MSDTLNVDTESPKETKTKKTVRIPKNGIVTPNDLGLIADAFLSYVFPEDAKQINTDAKYGQLNKKTGKSEISGYRSQYIINAMNEIIGPGNWREYGQEEVEKPATAFVAIYKGTLEIGNWKMEQVQENTYENGHIIQSTVRQRPYFEVLAQFHQTGGSRNMDKWEAIKGARTNFLKKVASYLSNGWKAYALTMDEDFESIPSEADKPKPTTRPPAPDTAGEKPQGQAIANAQLIAPEQKAKIIELYGLLGYTPEQIPERIKALEERIGKPFEQMTSGEAKNNIQKMQAQLEKNNK